MRALSSSFSSSATTTAAALLVMLCLVVVKVSSSGLGVGYEHVATVYPNQETGEWAAPCFQSNTATLQEVVDHVEELAYAVIIKPHYGKCWTCRDDYQMKLGNEILGTGSAYFGGVDNVFQLDYPDYQHEIIESQGIDIYVDMNAACNGLPKGAMRNPFKLAMESAAAMDSPN